MPWPPASPTGPHRDVSSEEVVVAQQAAHVLHAALLLHAVSDVGLEEGAELARGGKGTAPVTARPTPAGGGPALAPPLLPLPDQQGASLLSPFSTQGHAASAKAIDLGQVVARAHGQVGFHTTATDSEFYAS